jgi:hypothetical protein
MLDTYHTYMGVLPQNGATLQSTLLSHSHTMNRMQSFVDGRVALESVTPFCGFIINELNSFLGPCESIEKCRFRNIRLQDHSLSFAWIKQCLRNCPMGCRLQFTGCFAKRPASAHADCGRLVTQQHGIQHHQAPLTQSAQSPCTTETPPLRHLSGIRPLVI